MVLLNQYCCIDAYRGIRQRIRNEELMEWTEMKDFNQEEKKELCGPHTNSKSNDGKTSMRQIP